MPAQKTRSKKSSNKKKVSLISKFGNFSRKTQLVMLGFVFVFAAVGIYQLFYAQAAGNVPRDKPTWDKISPTLKQCESSNVPTKHSKTGKFHGLYQFNLDTWNGVRGGISGASDPHTASVAEQDAVAYKLFQQRGLQPWEGKCADQAYRAYKNSGGSSGGSSSSCESQTLRKGSSGDCVRYLQGKLNNHGAGISADGNFGPGTETAVKNFQSSRGLTADGVVGPNTWRALNGGSGGGTTSSQNQNPKGHIDRYRCDSSVGGWAYDPDNSGASIDVHIYIDGPAGSGASGFTATANGDRPDVRSAFGIGGNHGFDFRIPDQYRNGQPHTVYVYPINTPSGDNPAAGSGTTENCY